MTAPTDAQLYAAWAEGDRDRGAQLVDRHLPSLARYFANKVSSPSDAEDLVAETFEACARSLGKFRGESSFRGWLFGIAHNVLRAYLRSFGRAAIVELEDEPIETLLPTPTQRLAQRDDDKLLLAALRAIPLHSQIVLELSHFEELGRFEIAEVLGVPPGTIASRLRRGRQQLEAQLERLASSPRQLETTRRGLAGWIESIRRAVGDEG